MRVMTRAVRLILEYPQADPTGRNPPRLFRSFAQACTRAYSIAKQELTPHGLPVVLFAVRRETQR